MLKSKGVIGGIDDLGSDLMDTYQAARYLNLAPGTLNNLRTLGTGPAYIKIRTRVRYKREDLARWAKSSITRYAA